MPPWQPTRCRSRRTGVGAELEPGDRRSPRWPRARRGVAQRGVAGLAVPAHLQPAPDLGVQREQHLRDGRPRARARWPVRCPATQARRIASSCVVDERDVVVAQRAPARGRAPATPVSTARDVAVQQVLAHSSGERGVVAVAAGRRSGRSSSPERSSGALRRTKASIASRRRRGRRPCGSRSGCSQSASRPSAPRASRTASHRARGLAQPARAQLEARRASRTCARPGRRSRDGGASSRAARRRPAGARRPPAARRRRPSPRRARAGSRAGPAPRAARGCPRARRRPRRGPPAAPRGSSGRCRARPPRCARRSTWMPRGVGLDGGGQLRAQPRHVGEEPLGGRLAQREVEAHLVGGHAEALAERRDVAGQQRRAAVVGERDADVGGAEHLAGQARRGPGRAGEPNIIEPICLAMPSSGAGHLGELGRQALGQAATAREHAAHRLVDALGDRLDDAPPRRQRRLDPLAAAPGPAARGGGRERRDRVEPQRGEVERLLHLAALDRPRPTGRPAAPTSPRAVSRARSQLTGSRRRRRRTAASRRAAGMAAPSWLMSRFDGSKPPKPSGYGAPAGAAVAAVLVVGIVRGEPEGQVAAHRLCALPTARRWGRMDRMAFMSSTVTTPASRV